MIEAIFLCYFMTSFRNAKGSNFFLSFLDLLRCFPIWRRFMRLLYKQARLRELFVPFICWRSIIWYYQCIHWFSTFLDGLNCGMQDIWTIDNKVQWQYLVKSHTIVCHDFLLSISQDGSSVIFSICKFLACKLRWIHIRNLKLKFLMHCFCKREGRRN